MSELQVVRTPEMIAFEIRTIDQQTREIMLRNAIEIGMRLIEAKELVAHGEWGDWLGANVSYSQSSANNFMRVAKEYGDANSQAFANLNYTQAVALLGVPAEEREDFIRDNDAENKSARELAEAIKARKQAEKEAADAEKRAKEAEAKAEKERQARIELEQQLGQSRDLAEELRQTKEALEKAKATGSDEQVQRLTLALESVEGDLTDSQNRIKELEEELKAKPIEAGAAVEVIPPAILEELEALRAKAADQNGAPPSNESLVKFKLIIGNLSNGFNDLLGTLDEFEEGEEREKYKGAIGRLLQRMLESIQ
ncbi:DUF3102 domain-containing protein [Tumebacillus flagellatus]|uniref:DUF3102 domain-containing protein n=1 Tax=Tumebacillus flagellatus TaxID=1157490 RepID=A0A074MGD9_9BACL|nr:DUF3102 domain-containing protein [Tumebacillus flagellatus]KEO84777.1 hypothetical protein EL26_01840 [Tumebacillus flagellatus]